MLPALRLVSEAADLAARRHNGMARKGRGDEPYINHLAERSEEHPSELQSRGHLVCRLLLEKKKTKGWSPERHPTTSALQADTQQARRVSHGSRDAGDRDETRQRRQGRAVA